MIPLAAIKGSNFNKLNPQVKSYLEEIISKLSILIGQPAKLDAVEIFAGSFESFFKSYTKDYMLTKMSWDGKEGSLLFLTSMPLAIEMASFMMGIPAKTVKDRVASLQFDGEVEEAFGEVSNQLWGNLNRSLIDKIDKNTRLSLKSTTKILQDGSKNSEIDDLFYLVLKASVDVADLGAQPLFFLLSHLLVKDIFDVLLSPEDIGKEEESSYIKLTKELDPLKVENVMMRDYPVIEVGKSIKDAYQLMLDKKIDAVPLLQQGKVIRMITRNNLEIIRSVFFDAPGQEERNRKILSWPLVRVSPGQKLVSLSPSDLLIDAMRKMYTLHIHSLPIVDMENKFLGMLTTFDLLKKIAG